VLPTDSTLKRAVDCVLCSLCYIDANCFKLLLEWMGVTPDLIPDTVASAADTDDVKGSHQQQQQPLTDDIKADTSAAAAAASLQSNVFRSTSSSYQCTVPLHEAQLLTLATVCQSPVALRMLIDSGVISTLCTALRVTASHRLCETLDTEALASGNLATDAVKQCGADVSRQYTASSLPGTSQRGMFK